MTSIAVTAYAHPTDSYSGACMRCGAQVFTPPKETR